MRRLPLWVKVEASAGDDIRDTCAALVELARRLGCGVQCKFNGKLILADSDDTPERLYAEYMKRWETDR